MDYLRSSNLHYLFIQHPNSSFPDYSAHHFTLSVPSGVRCRDPSKGTQVMRIDCKNNLEAKKKKDFSSNQFTRELGGLDGKGYLR